MKIIKAQSLRLGAPVNTYFVPDVREAIEHSNATRGTQFDRAERRDVTGGIAQLWAGASSNTRDPQAFPEAKKYAE